MGWAAILAAAAQVIIPMISKLFGGGSNSEIDSSNSEIDSASTESNYLEPNAFQNLTGVPTTTDPRTTSRLNAFSSITPPTVPSTSPFRSTFTLDSTNPFGSTTPSMPSSTASSGIKITSIKDNPEREGELWVSYTENGQSYIKVVTQKADPNSKLRAGEYEPNTSVADKDNAGVTVALTNADGKLVTIQGSYGENGAFTTEPQTQSDSSTLPTTKTSDYDAQVYNVDGSEYKWGRQDNTIILLTRKYGEKGQGQKISYTNNEDGSISINGTSVVLQPNQIRTETDLATKVGGHYTDNRDRPDWNTNLFDDSNVSPTMIASTANLNLNSAMNGSFPTESGLTPPSGPPVADANNSGLLAAT